MDARLRNPPADPPVGSSAALRDASASRRPAASLSLRTLVINLDRRKDRWSGESYGVRQMCFCFFSLRGLRSRSPAKHLSKGVPEFPFFLGLQKGQLSNPAGNCHFWKGHVLQQDRDFLQPDSSAQCGSWFLMHLFTQSTKRRPNQHKFHHQPLDSTIDYTT